MSSSRLLSTEAVRMVAGSRPGTVRIGTWGFPPRWNRDTGRLADFLNEIPARGRWAIEFRDEDWLCDEVFSLLGRHEVALCVHDKLKDHPRIATAPWMYLRFHGEDHAGNYAYQFLTAEAKRIRGELASGLDVHAYFNNDQEGHAVRNAPQLRRYVAKAMEE